MKAVNIFAHHTAACHAGAYNGARSHQGKIVVTLEFFQQLPHGRTFDVETADGFGILKAFLHSGVVFKVLHLMYINVNAAVFTDNLCTLLDMPYSALAEDI